VTAVGEAVRNLQILEDEHLVEQVAAKGAYLQKKLQELRDHDIVGDVRGLGLLGGVELVSDKATKQSFDVAAGAARRVWQAALAKGVIVRPLGGDVIAMSPPFVITEQQIDRIVKELHAAIEEVGSQLRSQV
jgi:4-aminobutyrate--pyruvate transaminase